MISHSIQIEYLNTSKDKNFKEVSNLFNNLKRDTKKIMSFEKLRQKSQKNFFRGK